MEGFKSRQEWLEWRHKGIGSSDAPVVMGVSPWKTPFKLYEEKINPVIEEDNSNVWIKNKGNEIERKIRAQIEILHNTTYAPVNVQDADFEFLKASLDGRSEDKKSFIEIKLLGKEDYDLVKFGEIPKKYFPQVQHQFMVSGCVYGYFVCYLYDSKNHREYDSSRMLVIPIKLDKEYCTHLLEAEVKFWDCVVSKKPPVLAAKDYKTLKSAAKLVNQWKKLKAKIKTLSEEQDAIRKNILMMAEADGHPRLTCSGVSLMKLSIKGRVDYEKFLESKGIKETELEPFRKGGSIQWKMEPIEEKGTVQ